MHTVNSREGGQIEHRRDYKQSIPDTIGECPGAAASRISAARPGFAVGQCGGGAAGFRDADQVAFAQHADLDNQLDAEFTRPAVSTARAGLAVGKCIGGARGLHADPAVHATGTRGTRTSSSWSKSGGFERLQQFQRDQPAQPFNEHSDRGGFGLRQCWPHQPNGRNVAALGIGIGTGREERSPGSSLFRISHKRLPRRGYNQRFSFGTLIL